MGNAWCIKVGVVSVVGTAGPPLLPQLVIAPVFCQGKERGRKGKGVPQADTNSPKQAGSVDMEIEAILLGERAGNGSARGWLRAVRSQFWAL